MIQSSGHHIPGDEHIRYEYSPTFGTSNLAPHYKIDPRIVSHKESGASLSITVRVTNLRILVILDASSLRQGIEIAYTDLVEIRAVNNMLSSDYGVTIIDNSGMKIHLASTRPQVVALDLWNSVCTMLIASYGSQGLIMRALNQISRYQISSLSVPDDYYQLRAETLQTLINMGFSYPVNSRPTINHRLCADTATAWYQSQFSDKISSPAPLSSEEASPVSIPLASSEHYVYLPAISIGGGPYILKEWLVDHNKYVQKTHNLVRIWREDVQSHIVLCANDSGTLRHIKEIGSVLSVGDVLGAIRPANNNGNAVSLAEDSSLATFPNRQTTSNAVCGGALSASSGSIPRFQPSVACEPVGFSPTQSFDQDFKYALSNSRTSFQSFYNDVDAVVSSKINDDAIGLPCFDEALYCALVREMHRYSLAEIADNKTDLANKNAGLGAMVGSLLGLISGNIFAPFLGHSYGKNISDRSRRVEEFLPDPNLLFYQDENSYLSWAKAQVSAPRLRRLIFDRRVKADGNVFFRLIPAIVTADSVLPVQLFKIDSSTYFYRPFSAGIERNQPHYDSVKIQRRYFHLRGEGVVSETDMKVCVSGRDVEEHESKIFRFHGSSLDYFYLDFKTSPGSVF